MTFQTWWDTQIDLLEKHGYGPFAINAFYELAFKAWNAALQNTEVAATQAGAGEINSPPLSDNGPAHQIAELPLAGSPSDNSSQPETVMRNNCQTLNSGLCLRDKCFKECSYYDPA
jgi:hypothetical protein